MRTGIRAIAVVCALAFAGPAANAGDSAKRTKKVDQNFWDWAIAPYAQEINVVIQHATQLLQNARDQYNYGGGGYYGGGYYGGGYGGGYGGDNAAKELLLNDAYGMLQYAIKLDPDHVDVLSLLSQIAEESGRTDEARDYLERYLEVQVPDRVEARVYLRLGQLYVKLRRHDDAIANLRFALGHERRTDDVTIPATMTLADIYMQTGRATEAIDLLVHATDSAYGAGYYGYGYGNTSPLSFALAVAYDKDEQVTAAWETLDKLLATTQNNLYDTLGYSLQTQVFVPPIDRHYYNALMFEASGNLTEARSEWQLYTRGGDEAIFRGRAQQHIDAIDDLLREDLKKKPIKPPAVVTPVTPYPPMPYP